MLEIAALNKSHRFDAGDIETFAAAHVFAHGFVVQQNHIAGEFGEAGAVAFVGAAGDLIQFLAQHPTEFIGVGGAAKRAIEGCRLGGFGLAEKSSLFHKCSALYSTAALTLKAWGSPIYAVLYHGSPDFAG